MADNIYIGTNQVSWLDNAKLSIADGSAWLSFIVNGRTVWNGGEFGVWDTTSSNWNDTEECLGDNITFRNGDSVAFAADASLTVADGISVNKLTVDGGVTLTTTGELSVTTLELGKDASWHLAAGTSQSLNEAQLKGITQGSLVVEDGATLIMTDKTTAQNNRSSAFDNVSGTGNVVLNLANDNGVGFNLSGISGDITVATGRLQVNQSAFNEDSTIYLSTSGSQLVFNGNGTVLNNDVVLGANNTTHANSGCSGTIAGVISGNASFTKAGAGTLTFAAQNTYTGTTTISGGKLILANGGDYTLLNSVSGGTLEVANGTTLVNNGKEITSSLVLAAGSAAEMNGSCVLKGAITVNNGAVLTFIGNGSDTLDWNTGNPITVDGGTIDFGNTRQSIGSWAITLKNGALLTGTGENANDSDFNVALDFYRDATINVTSGENTIAATSRLRDSNERTLTYNVSENAALNVTGRIHAGSATATVGNVVKDGAGSELLRDGLRVVYTKANQTADAYIERMMHELGPDYSIRMITDDRLLQFSAVHSGISRVTTKEFWEELTRIGNEITEFARKLAERKG
jgi:autotransporter-associated beta strand protein